MNILVTVPSSNFNINRMKQSFAKNANLDHDHIYYSPNDIDLDTVDVFVGYDEQVLDQILDSEDSRLKWIQALSAGVDYFPLDKIKQRNVTLTTVKGIHAEPISESVIGMILSQYRFLEASAKAEGWVKPGGPLKMIHGKQAVIFGTGYIGQRIAELLTAFGANVIGANSSGHPADGFKTTISTKDLTIDEITNADLLINALPLTPATNNMYNADFFGALVKQPMFLSIGRGPSTNTEDLLAAIDNGKLGAAALDVTNPEPLPADHPLWQRANVLITSHVSGSHEEYMDESLAIFEQNAAQFEKDGRVSVNEVNLNKGY
ncbi:NAD(P)-dependent oxidoreductase [Lactobacillaceae bacterium Scapto_B20]